MKRLSGVPLGQSRDAPEFQQDQVPCRVIDVGATLISNNSFRFCQAFGLQDFHVISHMWNPRITKLMDEIKDLAKRNNVRYPEAVATGKWADLPATREIYQSIRGFLGILQQEGVKKVWMDTLCIDQSDDSREKSREIPLMASYYRYSRGCYVPINGFGFDYKLPLGEKDLATTLPWSNRVWTLQEFLFPERERMYFVVELEGWMEEWLALRVATSNYHFCLCCVGNPTNCFTLHAMGQMSERMKGVRCEVEKIREAHIYKHSQCSYCGSFPLVRRPGPGCRLYLIQPEAIFTLACLAQYHDRVLEFLAHKDACTPASSGEMYWAKGRGASDSSERWKATVAQESAEQGSQLLFQLMRRRHSGFEWWRPLEVLAEVSNRKCTFERDRVLGVLGLLGVTSTETLRLTAETGEDQLLELACSGAFPDRLLVELCYMDMHSGQSKPNMSWIPDLTGQISMSTYGSGGFDKEHCTSEVGERFSRRLKSLVENVRVAPHGPLTLTVHVLKGYATCDDSGFPEVSLSWKVTPHELCFVSNFDERLPNNQWYDFRHNHGTGSDVLNDKEVGFLRLPFRAPTRFYGFEMWLLCLAEAPWGKITMLVCLHKRGAGNVVHKLGVLTARWDFKGAPPEEVIVGGYGEYLEEHVDYDRPPRACQAKPIIGLLKPQEERQPYKQQLPAPQPKKLSVKDRVKFWEGLGS